QKAARIVDDEVRAWVVEHAVVLRSEKAGRREHLGHQLHSVDDEARVRDRRTDRVGGADAEREHAFGRRVQQQRQVRLACLEQQSLAATERVLTVDAQPPQPARVLGDGHRHGGAATASRATTATAAQAAGRADRPAATASAMVATASRPPLSPSPGRSTNAPPRAPAIAPSVLAASTRPRAAGGERRPASASASGKAAPYSVAGTSTTASASPASSARPVPGPVTASQRMSARLAAG